MKNLIGFGKTGKKIAISFTVLAFAGVVAAAMLTGCSGEDVDKAKEAADRIIDVVDKIDEIEKEIEDIIGEESPAVQSKVNGVIAKSASYKPPPPVKPYDTHQGQSYQEIARVGVFSGSNPPVSNPMPPMPPVIPAAMDEWPPTEISPEPYTNVTWLSGFEGVRIMEPAQPSQGCLFQNAEYGCQDYKAIINNICWNGIA